MNLEKINSLVWYFGERRISIGLQPHNPCRAKCTSSPIVSSLRGKNKEKKEKEKGGK